MKGIKKCGLTNYFDDEIIVRVFEKRVKDTPQSVALRYQEEIIYYETLNQKANQLASYLLKNCVKPKSFIGIGLAPSINLIVAIIAILKTGCAYVPFDPNCPMQRLQFMLEDANISLILTLSQYSEKYSLYCERIVSLDHASACWGDYSTSNLNTTIVPDDIAYVIYTSGSTGKPKGVIIPHSNVCRLFHVTQSLFHFHTEDIWTLFHSYTFDFSVWEIWGALFYGGTLVIVPPETTKCPKTLSSLLQKEKVTIFNQTPSAFEQFIIYQQSLLQPFSFNLRFIILGGEKLRPNMLTIWFKMYGDDKPQLVNMYGITETTVHTTYYPLKIKDSEQNQSIIGKPLSHLSIYLFDKFKQPVAVGEEGELYIGGSGLAKGYLNQPELTNQSFVYCLIKEGVSERLYKTGDLARLRLDGYLEFICRCDNQVKIRGHRIELGEIELTLSTHAFVKQATVLLMENITKHKKLVAWIVCHEQYLESIVYAEKIEILKQYLKEHLPFYMVPHAFVLLDSLPLTTNKKLDQNKLYELASQWEKENFNYNSFTTSATTQKQSKALWSEPDANTALCNTYIIKHPDAVNFHARIKKIDESLIKDKMVKEVNTVVYEGQTIKSFIVPHPNVTI